MIINMNIIDRIALNRLIKTIMDFIITIVKIFANKKDCDDNHCPIKKPRFPRLRKTIDNIFSKDKITND